MTILITAAGSAAAQPVLERLRGLGHRVVACDIYPRAWNIACFEADDYFQAVSAYDADAYTAQMLSAVRAYGLDMIIPLTDVEVDVLCSSKAELLALGCTPCVLDEPAARLCRDKLRMAQAVRDICRIIPTRSPYGYTPKDEDFPMLLKPVSGRSSQGQAIVSTREAYQAALSARDDYIAQPYLDGKIITVDVARDRFGSVQALARRELTRTANGLGTTVQTLPGHPLCEVCAAIAARAGIVGAVNMEFIEHGGDYWFLEVNPRFSGGVGFSVRAGLDMVALELKCHRGEAIGAQPEAQALTLTRKIELVATE